MDKAKKILKIFGMVVGVILLIWAIDLIRIQRKIDRGDLVKWGGQWYTKEQLAEKYPPQYIEVPAKNTPEEVYARFRQALLNNDIEGALEEIVLEKREEYREALKDGERLEKWVKTLPEEITKEKIEGNFGYYDIDFGTEYKNTVDFLKNSEGYWQIDSI